MPTTSPVGLAVVTTAEATVVAELATETGVGSVMVVVALVEPPVTEIAGAETRPESTKGVAVLTVVSHSKLAPSVKTARPAPMMPFARVSVAVVIWVLAGAEKRIVPELVPVPKASAPRFRRVTLVSPAMTEITPPDWFTLTAPSGCAAEKPARPRIVKAEEPPWKVSGDAPITEAKEPLLAKSSRNVPPWSVVVPM